MFQKSNRERLLLYDVINAFAISNRPLVCEAVFTTVYSWIV